MNKLRDLIKQLKMEIFHLLWNQNSICNDLIGDVNLTSEFNDHISSTHRMLPFRIPFTPFTHFFVQHKTNIPRYQQSRFSFIILHCCCMVGKMRDAFLRLFLSFLIVNNWEWNFIREVKIDLSAEVSYSPNVINGSLNHFWAVQWDRKLFDDFLRCSTSSAGWGWKLIDQENWVFPTIITATAHYELSQIQLEPE